MSRRPPRHRRPMLERLEGRALLATLTVVNANDSGAGSLRQAITDANSASEDSTIDFAIPGTGVQTIELRTLLPAISKPVTIDGSSQPGYSGSPLIEVDGGEIPSTPSNVIGVPNSPSGPVLTFISGADGSGVRGLIVAGSGSSGIVDDGPRITIADNDIGVGPDPQLGQGNGGGNPLYGSSGGISVEMPDAGSTGRTLITGNTIGQNTNGIALYGASGVTIAGNFIGTDSTQQQQIGNFFYGITADDATTDVAISNNVINNNTTAAINDLTDGGLTLSGNTTNNNGDQDYKVTIAASTGPIQATVGQAIQITFTVTNVGAKAFAPSQIQFVPLHSTGQVPGIVPSDPSPIFRVDSVTTPHGTVTQTSLYPTYQAVLDPIAPGDSTTISFNATIIGAGFDGEIVLGDPDIVTTITATAAPPPATGDLGVVSAASPAAATIGEPETFAFTVTNHGTAAAAALFALSASAPVFYPGIGSAPGLAQAGVLVSQGSVAELTPGSFDARYYGGDLGMLGPGASATVTVVVIPPVGGIVSASLYAYSANVTEVTPADNLAFAAAQAGGTTTPGSLLAGGTALPASKSTPIAALSLYFSTDLNPTEARTASLYHVNGQAVRSAAYDPTTRVVTLRLARPLPRTGPALNVTVAGLPALTNQPFIGPSITITIPRT